MNCLLLNASSSFVTKEFLLGNYRKTSQNAAGATRDGFNGVVRLLRYVIFRYKKEISFDSRPRSFINWPIHYETRY